MFRSGFKFRIAKHKTGIYNSSTITIAFVVGTLFQGLLVRGHLAQDVADGDKRGPARRNVADMFFNHAVPLTEKNRLAI
jgi:hypothetical protein